MKTLRRSLLWMMALALPASLLLLLPLNAQETTKPEAQTPAQSPAQKPAQSPAPAAESVPAAEPAKNDELPPDERVSADNNLSFPVDI